MKRSFVNSVEVIMDAVYKWLQRASCYGAYEMKFLPPFFIPENWSLCYTDS